MDERMQEILCQHNVRYIRESRTITIGISALTRKPTSSYSILPTMVHGKKIGLASPASTLILDFLALKTVNKLISIVCVGLSTLFLLKKP